MAICVNSVSLSYLFTSLCLRDLFNGKLDKIKKVYEKCGAKSENIVSVADFYNFCYGYLLNNHKNEYIFKNLIAQKILMGRHSLKNSTLFTELRISTSKVDVAIFNGTSHAYEIKTEFDNFDKLIKQLSDYKKVFEYINIVTIESKLQCLEKVLCKLDKNFHNKIGILVLTDRKTLSTKKKACSNLENIEHDHLFKLLHKNEYLQIIEKYFDNIPQVPNTQIYEVCKNLFVQLPKQIVCKEVVMSIKQRKQLTNLANNIKKMPEFIKVAIIDGNLSILKQSILLSTLAKKL